MPVRPGGPAARGGEQLRAEPGRAGRPAPERHAPGRAGGGRDGPAPEGRPGVGEGELRPPALHAPGRQPGRVPGRLGPGVHRAPEAPGSRGPSRPGRGPGRPAGATGRRPRPGRRVPGHTRVRVRRRIRLDPATAPSKRGRAAVGRPHAAPAPQRLQNAPTRRTGRPPLRRSAPTPGSAPPPRPKTRRTPGLHRGQKTPAGYLDTYI